MDSYVGEIRMMLTEFAPQYWHLCDGTVLPISGNEALFSLLGTTWGGDGRTTFGLPDYRSRLPVGQGQGTGLTNNYVLAQTGGVEIASIMETNIPQHNHSFNVANVPANQTTPGSGMMFANPVGGDAMYIPSTMTGTTSPVPNTGTLLPYPNSSQTTAYDLNVMPSFPLTFMICLVGTYPQKP